MYYNIYNYLCSQ